MVYAHNSIWQGWRSRDKSRSRDLPRDLNFKVSISRLGEKFGSQSRSRSDWISVSKQKLRLETFFKFWKKHATLYPELSILAFQVLCVPATSAPVERVFSQSDLLFRPHRARLSSDLLSMLVYLRCNKNSV